MQPGRTPLPDAPPAADRARRSRSRPGRSSRAPTTKRGSRSTTGRSPSHGEQGGWTLDTFCQRQQEPWFDPDGFRVLDDVDGRDGRRSAGPRCTNQPDPHGDPTKLGEIYVIAVDPDFHGRGLGRQLTLAGLDHLRRHAASRPACSTSTPTTPPRSGCTNGSASRSTRTNAGVRRRRRPARDVDMTSTDEHRPTTETLPRWSVADVHESLDARSFTDALEQAGADVDRLVALFDEHDIRAIDARPPTPRRRHRSRSRDRRAQPGQPTPPTSCGRTSTPPSPPTPATSRRSRCSARLRRLDATLRPLTARLADWVAALGVDELAARQRRGRRAPSARSAASPHAPSTR